MRSILHSLAKKGNTTRILITVREIYDNLRITRKPTVYPTFKIQQSQGQIMVLHCSYLMEQSGWQAQLRVKVYGSVVRNSSVLAIFLLAQGLRFQELQLLV
jgi:hypothetical protein